jgi:hypothetical protein
MAQNTNLNVSPYYDDFDGDKNFYRVLFRPGRPVQTRELTTLQSILQDQIEKYGNYQFKQGELVIPGEVGLNTRLNYVKLSSVSEVAVNVNGQIEFKKYDISGLEGEFLVGSTSGVRALVLSSTKETDSNSDTLFVSYVSNGDSNTESTFRQGETLEVLDGVNTPTLTVGTDGAVLPNFITIEDVDTGETNVVPSPAIGFASGVKIEEGVYFINGFFVRNSQQLIILDPYNNKASGKIAFNVLETIVTPEEDSSLYDNSRGTSNFSAPGGHRLKIELIAKKYSYTEILDKNSVELISIKNGLVEKKIRQKEYNLIEETLARRTYDESGDYVVSEFGFDIREYYQKNDNTGLYKLNSNTNLVNGLSETEASSKLIGTIGSGKAYVKGYELVNKETKYVTIDKSRDSITRPNVTIKNSGYSSFYITNLYGSVPLNAEGVELTAYPNVYMFGSLNDGNIGLNGLESDYANSVDLRGKLLSQQPNNIGPGVNAPDLDLTPSNIGVKTILINPSVDYLTYSSTYTPPVGSYIYIIKSVGFDETAQASRTLLVEKVRVISSAFVQSKKVNPSGNFNYIELKVVGKRDVVDSLLKEYDTEDPNVQRRIFIKESDAFDINDTLPGDSVRANYYWGTIVDYTETYSPLIGVCKPSNISFVEIGQGFNPLKDKVASRGISASGEEIYNSIYKFGYFNPVFFTKIILTSNFSNGFDVGKYITGSTSGAYGVVEGTPGGSYSSTNTLHIKVQQGQFVEGETIVDEDGNIAKIAKSNTLSHFVVHQQGFNYNANSVIVVNGTQFDKSKISVTRVSGGNSIAYVKIEDDIVRDVTYVNPPQVSVTEGTGSLITAVLFKNTVHTYNVSEVKSFYSSFGSGSEGQNIFTADVEVSNNLYSNFQNITTSTFSGTKGYDFLEINSLSVDLGQLLRQGDIVQYVENSGKVRKAVVVYATSSNTSVKSRVYLDATLRDNVTNSVLTKIYSSVENPNASSLISSGTTGISSIVKDITDSKITYYFRRDFVAEGSSSGGSLTFAAQLPFGTQRFVSFNKENYIMSVLYPGSSSTDNLFFKSGDIVEIKPEYVTISGSTDEISGLVAGSATITFPEEYFGTDMTEYPKVKLTTTIEVSKAKPKLKTAIKNKRIVITPSNDKVIPLRGQDYDTGELAILSYSDVYKLRYIYEGSLVSPPKVDANGTLIEGKDITSNFIFDDGQRPSFYDVSRIILKPGIQVPTGKIVIGFDYFEHSQGEFCSVDSYLHESGVPLEEIPSYESDKGNISLRDVIDFRPKVDSTVVISGFQNKTLLSSSNYISFNGAGGAPSVSLAADSNLEYSIKFDETSYLDRIDALFLNKSGEFFIKKGTSSKNPAKPDLVDDAIPLNYIYIPAITENSKDIKIFPVDNKRYTMRDIGKLEKRVERLEYYTSLSILEQQTLNMQIKDSFGFDKFKSGFLVDNFESHGVGNVSSDEYRCSIDPQQSVLRPEVYEDNVKLIESNSKEVERQLNGYVKNNDVVTLPYESTYLLGNSSATGVVNPNPFVVLQYVGDLNINPVVDNWYDTNIVPLVTNNNTNLFNIFISKENKPEDAYASIHNSFLINWTGVNSAFNSINSLSTKNTQEASSTSVEALISSSSNISPNNNEVAKGVPTKSSGEFYVCSSVQFFVRSIPVKFVVTRMKPNTVLYPFIDGRDVTRWTIPDSNFTGIPSSSLTSFGGPIVTDDNGSASGIILIPAGYPPKQGTTWNGDILDVSYDTTAEKIHLVAGQKNIRFTSSSTNAAKEELNTYAEINYYSRGLKPENPQSIVSTQPSYFKSNEGIQFVESNTDNLVRPNPLSQTFRIENYDGGLFVTGLDLYFNKKSQVIPIKIYLTDVNVGKPGKNIIPGSEVVLLSKTYLQVYSSGNISLNINDNLTGVKSGAVGPIEKILDKNGIEVTLFGGKTYNLTNEQVYTFVLSNHNGKSFVQDELLSSSSIVSFNATNNTNVQLKIAKDSGKVVSFEVEQSGSNYEGAIITIESPQLPGESIAIASPSIFGGIIYNVDVATQGSGYTSPPSVVVRGIGNGAGGASVKSIIEIDTPAVRMGVAVDDADQISKIPTNFKFDYPVYLQNDTNYAIQIETDSTEYKLWSSKLGSLDIISGIQVSSQPLIGSLYRSQNTDTWVEDSFEDLKFTLTRAKFDISKTATLKLVNESLPYQKLKVNPFETSSASNSNATSDLFKANNSVVKVTQRNHGFEDTGLSRTFFRGVQDFSGISGTSFNKKLYAIDSCGIDTYTIISPTQASQSGFGGGTSIYATKHVKYEKLYADIAYLQSPKTKIETEVRTINVVPVDSRTQNYLSYNISDFEKTFLNQEQYFETQKFVASSINEVLNDTGKSLTYKLSLSSEVDYLSPLIDLRNTSVKTTSSRIDNSTGYEDRFGKRYEVVKFWPVYTFTIDAIDISEDPIQENQTLIGRSSSAEGTIVNVFGNVVTVRMKNNGVFESGEGLIFGTQNGFNDDLNIKISNSEFISVEFPPFDLDDNVVAYNEISNIKYTNIINGEVISWDSATGELVIGVEKKPINNNYTSASLPDGDYARNSNIANQDDDIFRVNDYIYTINPTKSNIQLGKENYFKIKSTEFKSGVDYRSDIETTITSSISKYLTKDILLNIPATSIDVRLTANITDSSNVIVMYKILGSSSQENLSDIKWNYLPAHFDEIEFKRSNSISGVFEKRSEYKELKYYINDLEEFNRYAIKIILKSDNPSFSPKVQDLRVVASI